MHHQKRRLTTTFNHPQKSIRMYHSHACVCLMSHASFNIRSVRLHSDAEGVDWTAEISATKLVQGRKRVAVDKFRAKERESVGGRVRLESFVDERTWNERRSHWILIKDNIVEDKRMENSSNSTSILTVNEHNESAIYWVKSNFSLSSRCSIVPARPQTLYFPITDFFSY